MTQKIEAKFDPKGLNIQIEAKFNIGSNLEQAIEVHGSKLVFEVFSKAAIVIVQAAMRVIVGRLVKDKKVKAGDIIQLTEKQMADVTLDSTRKPGKAATNNAIKAAKKKGKSKAELIAEIEAAFDDVEIEGTE